MGFFVAPHMSMKPLLLLAVAAALALALLSLRGFGRLEGFGDALSLAALWRHKPGAFCEMARGFTTGALYDSNDILMYRTCVASKDSADAVPLPERLAKFARRDAEFAMVPVEGLFADFDRVRDALRSTLRHLRARARRALAGPAYVLIYQAPYWQDERGGGAAANRKPIHVQPFNLKEYGYAPEVVVRDDGADAATADKAARRPLYIAAYLMLPMLRARTLKRIDVKGDADTKAYVEGCLKRVVADMGLREEPCFVHCVGDTDAMCGCLNLRGDKYPYASACHGPGGTGDRQKAQLVNYGTLYRVNESQLPDVFDLTLAAFDERCVPPPGLAKSGYAREERVDADGAGRFLDAPFDECAAACTADAACVGYVTDNGRGRGCSLKTTLGARTTDALRDTWVKNK